MEKFKKHWNNTPVHIRKPIVFVVGVLIVLAGVAMLVLPGPGWAAIFLGFAILATEFKSADRVKRQLIRLFKAIVQRLRALLPKKK